MNTLREFDYGYLAAAMDFEGSITIRRMHKGNVTYLYPEIRIGNTNKNMLIAVKDIVGAGYVYGPHKKHKPQHKPSYTYALAGKKAKELLRLILPFLIDKKERAELVLKHRSCRGSGFNKVDIETIEYNADLHRKIKELNRRGIIHTSI